MIYSLSFYSYMAPEIHARQPYSGPGVRLSFLDGVLEIRKVPGRKHETVKKRIAALVEIYLEFLGLDFTPTGSVTLESESNQVKREADESYELSPNRKRPDLVIEVIVTSGNGFGDFFKNGFPFFVIQFFPLIFNYFGKCENRL